MDDLDAPRPRPGGPRGGPFEDLPRCRGAVRKPLGEQTWCSAPTVRCVSAHRFQLSFVISPGKYVAFSLIIDLEWPIPAATCGPTVGPQVPSTGPTRPGFSIFKNSRHLRRLTCRLWRAIPLNRLASTNGPGTANQDDSSTHSRQRARELAGREDPDFQPRESDISSCDIVLLRPDVHPRVDDKHAPGHISLSKVPKYRVSARSRLKLLSSPAVGLRVPACLIGHTAAPETMATRPGAAIGQLVAGPRNCRKANAAAGGSGGPDGR